MSADVVPIKRQVIAKAQPGPQRALLTCPSFEIFFGGARGGGKTFGLCLHWMKHVQRLAERGVIAKGILFRRSYKELEEVIDTFLKVLVPCGAVWRTGAGTLQMPNGAVVKLRHLSNKKSDASLYQGHQYTWMGFDEVTNWASSVVIDEVKATVRGDPQCQVVMTGNPGGVGHNWVKGRFVDPNPKGMHEFVDPVTEQTRVFIPSLLSDNDELVKADPQYVNRLKGSGPEWLVRAWLQGDWNIVAGGMFDDVWGAGNVLTPFKIPASWRVDRAFDWGSARPFSVGWYAESDGTTATAVNGELLYFPRGSVIRIAEWYGCGEESNTGLTMLAKDIAEGIVAREKIIKQNLMEGDVIKAGPADSSIFSVENGACVADDMAAPPNKVRWTPADKRPGSRVMGWNKLRELFAYGNNHDKEFPGFYVFSTCVHFIRIVPGLPRDDRNMEDLDTDSEDHIADEVRYRVASKALKTTQFRIGGT